MMESSDDDERSKRNFPRIKVLPPRKFKEDEELAEKEKERQEKLAEEDDNPKGTRVFREDLLKTDSEYHTATEFIPEFQSENEPPEDKIAEAKIIFKSETLRVYKKILKIGQGNLMSAKYDLVKYKLKETRAESMDLEYLDQSPEIEGQMGLTLVDGELVICLSHLKQGEKSTFRVEEVGYDDRKRRVIKRERFLLAEMIGWQTVIDVNGDLKLMKKVLERGTGQKRFDTLDEITFSCHIYQEGHPEVVLRKYDLSDCLVDSLETPLPSCLVEVLKTSKAQEKFEVTADFQYVLEHEIDDDFKASLQPDLKVVYHVEVEAIYERIDLFHDGSVIKKVIQKSFTSASPDENSRIYFDYRVLDSQKNLIYSSIHL